MTTNDRPLKLTTMAPQQTPIRNILPRAAAKYAAGDRVLCNRRTGFHGTVDEQQWTVTIMPRGNAANAAPVYRVRWDAPFGPDGKHGAWHMEGDLTKVITEQTLPVNDMQCAACQAEVHNQDKPSISVVQWMPDGRFNVLRAVLCNEDCLADWARFVVEAS